MRESACYMVGGLTELSNTRCDSLKGRGDSGNSGLFQYSHICRPCGLVFQCAVLGQTAVPVVEQEPSVRDPACLFPLPTVPTPSTPASSVAMYECGEWRCLASEYFEAACDVGLPIDQVECLYFTISRVSFNEANEFVVAC